MSVQSTKFPTLLFPLKIEARFVSDELWLRVFPDEAFLQSHQIHLTKEELQDHESYRSKKMVWAELVEKYGAYRAAYIVHFSDERKASNDVTKAEKEHTFFYKSLPEEFSIFLTFDDASGKERTVQVADKHTNSLGDKGKSKYLVVFGDKEEEDEWVTDFKKAVEIGMGFKINLQDDTYNDLLKGITHFKRIIITGLYKRNNNSENQKLTANDLNELLENHLYTEGLGFIAHGTPTNNVPNERSGYSVRDEFEVEENYKVLIEGLELNTNSVGSVYSDALGLAGKPIFKHIHAADTPTDQFTRLFQKLTWMAMGGNAIQMVLGEQLSKSDQIALWERYYHHVFAKGKFSAIKVGDQPYALFPAISVSSIKNDNATNQIDKVLSILYASLKERLEKFEVPKMKDQGEAPLETLFNVLSLQAGSVKQEIDVLKYSKLRGQIDHGLLEQAGLVETIGELSVGEAYQKLAEFDSSYAEKYKQIQHLSEGVRTTFEAFDLDKNALSHRPIFSFLDIEEDHKLNVEHLFDLQEKSVEALKTLFTLIREKGNNANNSNGETAFLQFMEESTFFTDLLLHSYSNTISLFEEGGARNEARLTYANEVLDLLDIWQKNNESDRKKLVQSAFQEVLDINSYRLDAWISSIALARLDELRKANASGIYFGAYGFIEDLKKDEQAQVENTDLVDKNRTDDGGIIHCPSPAQSLTATLFKNSFLTHLQHDTDFNQEVSPFTLNLTSERVQISEQFMQGIREDQEIEALLGYKLERYLHEVGLDDLIYKLREAFPLEVNIVNRADNNPDVGFKQMSVINGLEILEATKDQEKEQRLGYILHSYAPFVFPMIQKLEHILDASLDHLFYEAGYQLTQGNLSQSAAAMDAAKGDLSPPVTDALKTKFPGVGMTHKLAYFFPKAKVFNLPNSKAFLEPTLETWLEKQIGKMSDIECQVKIKAEGQADQSEAIHLDALGIGYLDLMYLSDSELSKGASELEVRIVQQLGMDLSDKTYEILSEASEGKRSLSEAIEIIRYAYKLLTKCRSVQASDFQVFAEDFKSVWKPLEDIHDRVIEISKELDSWKNNIADYLSKKPELSKEDLEKAKESYYANLSHVSKLNITEAKRSFLKQIDVDAEKFNGEVVILQASLNTQLADYNNQKEASNYFAAFRALQEAAKILFGKAFVLMMPNQLPTQVIKVLNDGQKQSCLVGSQELETGVWGQSRVQQWVSELAQVEEGFTVFEEYQFVQSIWENKVNETYRIVQFPTHEGNYPWVALSKEEIKQLLESTIYEIPKEKKKKKPERYKDENGETYPITDKLDNRKLYYPDGSESIVVYGSDQIVYNSDDLFYGLLIDDFSEHIPDEKMNTGVSFHYNAPNNEAPQALLLAVSPPNGSNDWSADMLKDIVNDTIDLMKIRMIDPLAIEEMEASGDHADFVKSLKALLPMTYWFNIPSIN